VTVGTAPVTNSVDELDDEVEVAVVEGPVLAAGFEDEHPDTISGKAAALATRARTLDIAGETISRPYRSRGRERRR
jgi:hypothetical protein